MKSAVLLLLFAGCALAQVVLKPLPITPPPVPLPTIILPPPPPPPNVCFPDRTLTTSTAADTEADDAGAAGVDSFTILPPTIKCKDGPVRKIHSVPNEFHWPPIYRGSCDDLWCKDPECLPRVKVWRSRCVLVYRLVNGCWRRLGFRVRRYQDHLSCACKQCSDITTQKECVNTKPCPNSNSTKDFCYWRPGPYPIGKRQAASSSIAIPIPLPIPFPISKCACCTPKKCPKPKTFDETTCSCICPRIKCPPGRVFNARTCTCDCPPGSKLLDGKCIGDCDDVPIGYCPHVNCLDNKHFRCQVDGHKCLCPSCPKATDLKWCEQTKCLEQRGKPKCVYDYGRCRCPTCADQSEESWCKMTYCGPNNSRQCKFDPWYEKCSCPHY